MIPRLSRNVSRHVPESRRTYRITKSGRFRCSGENVRFRFVTPVSGVTGVLFRRISPVEVTGSGVVHSEPVTGVYYKGVSSERNGLDTLVTLVTG